MITSVGRVFPYHIIRGAPVFKASRGERQGLNVLMDDPRARRFTPVLGVITANATAAVRPFTIFRQSQGSANILMVTNFHLIFRISQVFIIASSHSVIKSFRILMFNVSRFSRLGTRQVNEDGGSCFLSGRPPFPIEGECDANLFVGFRSVDTNQCFGLLFVIFQKGQGQIPVHLGGSMALRRQLEGN